MSDGIMVSMTDRPNSVGNSNHGQGTDAVQRPRVLPPTGGETNLTRHIRQVLCNDSTTTSKNIADLDEDAIDERVRETMPRMPDAQWDALVEGPLPPRDSTPDSGPEGLSL
jgi:hypothetical protein